MHRWLPPMRRHHWGGILAHFRIPQKVRWRWHHLQQGQVPVRTRSCWICGLRDHNGRLQTPEETSWRCEEIPDPKEHHRRQVMVRLNQPTGVRIRTGRRNGTISRTPPEKGVLLGLDLGRNLCSIKRWNRQTGTRRCEVLRNQSTDLPCHRLV